MNSDDGLTPTCSGHWICQTLAAVGNPYKKNFVILAKTVFVLRVVHETDYL